MPRPPFLDDPALTAVLDALPGARIVGGAVRDALAGRPVADIDLATPMPPEQVTTALRRAGLKAVPTGLDHGTVTAVSHGRGFEVTTLRRDVTTDGRRATVVFTGDWREDAARRDFTINAMSMDRDGAIHDPFGGQADLAAGRVRFVGDAATRIAEDYLRILRFFRFWSRYGRGAPDAEAVAAIRAGIPGLAILSAERVWSEIKRILAAPDRSGSVALMAETGALAAILPEGADAARLIRLVAAGAPADPLLRFAALLADGVEVAALAERLRLSGAEAARLERLRDPALRLAPDATDRDIRHALHASECHAADVVAATHLAEADAPSPGWGALRDRIGAMPVPVFPLEGRDVVALGVPAGPGVGRVLRQLRQEWREGGYTADEASLRARLAQIATTS